MDRRLPLALFRLAFAALTIVAIAYQFAQLADAGTLVPLNFFSYFTIQSNLIAVAVFLVGTARWRSDPRPGWDMVRGAAVVYMTVTFVLFALLLSGTDVDTTNAWVNTVVHQLMPIAVVADWLLDPPRRQISFRDSLVWLVYPLAWTAYTLIRGPIAGWYPYPFLDPANGGYGTVAAYVFGILIFGAVLCWVVATVGTMLGSRLTKKWGGKRQNITVRGTNNVMYAGVCNLTGGTYCRLKRIKGRGPGTLANPKKKKRPVQRKGRKLTYQQILDYYARLGSRRNGPIGAGDKVKVSGKFLRSTGQYTGPIGQAKGVVMALQDLGGLVLATIKWDRPGVGEKFNVKNLLKVGTVEHFENRKKVHRNPRSKDLGAYIRVTMTAADVARFKSRWPASGLPDRAIWFEFQRKNGDLVDISPGSDKFDGPALAALADDAKKFAGL
jgi:hypothetical protein